MNSRRQSHRSLKLVSRATQLCVECLESRRLLAAGDLDPSFGVGGKVITDVLSARSQAVNQVAVQNDGKVIAVGSVQDVAGTDFAVVRFNTDGSTDSSFGMDGGVTTDFGGFDVAHGVTIQPDGRIIAVGRSDGRIALARYNADGSLDTAFGSGGKVTTLGPTSDGRANAVALEPDGDIVIAGTFGTSVGGVAYIALARYKPDGSLDASFSSNVGIPGVWRHGQINSQTRALALAIQADGKYVTSGNGATVDGFSGPLLVARFEATGDVDTGFGNGVLLSHNPFGSSVRSNASSLSVLPDGRIVVGGYRRPALDRDFAVGRLLPDGTPDTSFDGDGLAVTSLGATELEEVVGVSVQGDGKVVGVGTSGTFITPRHAAVRYNADGSLDTSFDADGVALGAAGRAFGGTVQPDGAIIGAGASVSRLTSAGAVDATWDGDGIATSAVLASRTDQARKVIAVQSDGKLLVVGETTGLPGPGSTQNIAVARYLADGSLDPSFGEAGVARLDFGPINAVGRAIALRPDGKILIAGTANSDFLLTRLNTDGSLDTSFFGGGWNTVSFGTSDAVTSIAIQSDDKIVVAGQATVPGTAADFALARYTADGMLDTTFDGDGMVTTAFGAGAAQDFASGIAIQPDGKIVAAGIGTMAGTGADFALARYNTDGSLDTSFDFDGMTTTAFLGSPSEVARAVAIQSDGRIVAAGTANQNMAIARFNVDGSLDDGGAGDSTPGDSYGTAGRTTTDFGFTNDVGNSLALQANGKAIVAGGAGGDFALAKYLVDGTLDSSFGIAGKVVTDFGSTIDSANGVALQADGKIVAVGLTSTGSSGGNDFAIARYLGDNTAPSADASGPYSVDEGGSVALSAGSSSDNEDAASALTYEWDLDGDNVVGETGIDALRGDETGDSPTFSAEGLDGFSSYTVTLAVTDSGGLTDEAIATINVNNVDPSIDSVSNNLGLVEGSPASVTISASDAAGSLDPLTYYFDFDNDSVYEVVSASNSESHVYDDNGSYTVNVKVTDGDGGEDLTSTSIVVSNVAPELAMSGPTSAVPGQSLLFTFNSTDVSAADQAGNFTYNIDWDGNGSVDQTVVGGASIQVAHAYVATGSFTAKAATTDKDGGQSSEQAAAVIVSSVNLTTDSCDPTKTMLVVGGTDGDDQINVSPTDSGQLHISIGGATMTVDVPTGRIVIYGLAGNDNIQIAGSVSNVCWIYGDDGADNLNLGNGGGIAFGGNGNDHLLGGSARDVLLGSRGGDRVVGNPGDDILIAAYTKFDSRPGYTPAGGFPTFAQPSVDHEDAWCHLYAEWNNSEGRNYTKRIANLTGAGIGSDYADRENAFYFLKTEGSFATGQSVFDDGNADEIDFLTGASGEDWFLANTGNGSGEGGAVDKITGGGSGETRSDTDAT